MYKATQNFKSYKLGDIKQGQEVDHNQTWEDEGLIELETKPQPKAEIETKPKKTKAKNKK